MQFLSCIKAVKKLIIERPNLNKCDYTFRVASIASRSRVSILSWFNLTLLFLFLSYIILNSSIQYFDKNTKASVFENPSALLNIILSSLLLGFSLSTKPQQLNMSFFWLFQFFFFGIVPLCTFLDPNPIYLAQISPTVTFIFASELTLMSNSVIALLQFQIFYKTQLNPKYSDVNRSLPTNFLKRLRRLVVIYILLLPFMLSYLGGGDFLFKKVRIQVATSGVVSPGYAIVLSIILVTPLIALLSLLYIRKFKLADVHINYQLVLVAWVILLSNPFGQARQTTLFLILPLFFFWLRDHRISTQLFFTVLPIFLVFSANPVNRYTGALQLPSFAIPSRNGDYDAFAQFVNGIQLVSENAFPLFRQIFGSIAFFVPRVFWPSKPNDTGMEIGRLLGLNFQNLSSPWLAEAYVNARLPGILIVSYFIGIHLTRLDLQSIQNFPQFLIAAMVSGSLFIVLRGSLLQATGRISFALAMIAFMCREPRHYSRFAKPAPPP